MFHKVLHYRRKRNSTNEIANASKINIRENDIGCHGQFHII